MIASEIAHKFTLGIPKFNVFRLDQNWTRPIRSFFNVGFRRHAEIHRETVVRRGDRSVFEKLRFVVRISAAQH